MKLGFLVLAMAVTTALLAIVHISEPATGDFAAGSLARQPFPASIIATPPNVAEPGPAAEQRPSLQIRQAPVPLLMKARTPIEVDLGDAASISAPPPRSDIADGVAKAFIEADGYKSVSVLSRGQDGVWRAKALRGTTEVLITVDAQGNVSAN
jgi:hypothetical protein